MVEMSVTDNADIRLRQIHSLLPCIREHKLGRTGIEQDFMILRLDIHRKSELSSAPKILHIILSKYCYINHDTE